MNIKTLKLTDIKPAPYNPRRISEDAMRRLERSLAEFGLVQPLIVNQKTGRLIGGHQRLKLLQKQGIKETECVLLDLTPAREKALNVALNNKALMGEDDREMLAALLEDPGLAGIDRTLTGFNEQEIKAITMTAPSKDKADEDDIPALEKHAVTKRGEEWHLGPHRILCQDALFNESYAQVMNGDKADLIFTDPPYGVDYKSGNFEKIANDSLKHDGLGQFIQAVLKKTAGWSRPSAAWYIWHASIGREDFAWAMKGAGLQERQYLIWVKPSHVMGRADYHWQHEPCFYASQAGETPPFYGDRTQSTVWTLGTRQVDKQAIAMGSGLVVSDGQGHEVFIAPGAPKTKRVRRIRLELGQSIGVQADSDATDCWFVRRDGAAEHPTQKPVELARRALLNSSKPGQVVLDPFLGSGTTLIGAEATGRICRGLELCPAYVDVAVRRWQRFTGKKASNVNRPGVTIS